MDDDVLADFIRRRRTMKADARAELDAQMVPRARWFIILSDAIEVMRANGASDIDVAETFAIFAKVTGEQRLAG